MALSVLGIAGSPRAGGNSDRLLREALRGAEDAGGRTEFLAVRDHLLGPCLECNACFRTGLCRVDDDFQAIFAKLLAADRIVFATPIFFMAVSAQAKLLIDRCQCLWSRKYVLRAPLHDDGPHDRRSLVIAVGGSKSKKMFDAVRMTMHYWLDALGVAPFANLFVNRVDGRGDAERHPSALGEAFRLGRALVAEPGPPPDKPTTVELFGWEGAERAVPGSDDA